MQVSDDMSIDDPTRLGALEAAAAIAKGDLTAEALAKAYLRRIADRYDDVGAWESHDPDRVLDEARARDAETPRSPLHGVPFGVKDIIDVAGYPTRMGSKIYADAQPALPDAAAVAMARDAGMVPLGKTVTTEFALRSAGKTRNPHRLSHSPGGSSSGSAAAVADFQAPLAIGTQTGGSVVRPASYCGVVGYKPTFGRISRAGVKSVSESLDTVGVMARSVADAAAFAAILEGAEPPMSLPALTRPRIAFARTPAWDALDASAHKVARQAVDLARAAGASVIEMELPQPFREALAAQETIMAYEAQRALAYELRFRSGDVSRKLKDYIGGGADIARDAYDEARNVQATCRATLWSFFADIGALITPAAPGEAPANPSDTGSAVANQIWTMAGAPVVGVPGLRGPDGLPIGMQVIGPSGRAAGTLAHAAWLQDALKRNG